MKKKRIAPTTDQEASGPLVAVCTGHRCDALHRLVADQDGTERLRPTIAAHQGAILVSTQCMGACANGAVAAIARRDGTTGATGASVWLGGIDQPSSLSVLLDWIALGGPPDPAALADAVPTSLRNAVIGIGQPIEVRSAKR